MLRFVAFNVSPFIGHLWYLGAILYTLIIVWILNKLCPQYTMTILYVIAPFLLIANLILGKYSVVTLHKVYPNYFVRNFAFEGIPYFSIGCFMRKKITTGKAGKVWWLLIVISIAAISSIAEESILTKLDLSGAGERYISTTVLSIAVFLLFCRNQWKGKCLLLHNIGKKHSTNIYIVHPLVQGVFDVIRYRIPDAYRLSIYEEYMRFRPIVVFFGSVLVSIAINKLSHSESKKVVRKMNG